MTASGDRANEARASLNAGRTNCVSRDAARDEDLSGFPGRRFLQAIDSNTPSVE